MNNYVLYADDDADDRAWVQETCAAINAQVSISFLENGRQVLDLLQTLSITQLPSLIILDLNMPLLDGRQTLQRLKSDPRFNHIKVAIVSTSSSQLDREACRFLGAELFLSKPNSFAEWQTVLHQLMPFAV